MTYNRIKLKPKLDQARQKTALGQAFEDAFVGLSKTPIEEDQQLQIPRNSEYVPGLSPSARVQARIERTEIVRKKRAFDVTALYADQNRAPTALAVASIEQACMSLASQIIESISAQIKGIEAEHLGSK